VQPEGLGEFKKSPHRVSNPRPSGLCHSALTTTLPRVGGCGNIRNADLGISDIVVKNCAALTEFGGDICLLYCILH
jgi:hypothetical protein